MAKTKALIGTVVSDKMKKTVVVRVMHMSKHQKYGSIRKRYNKFKVHDENNVAKTGDIVKILETRPLSKEKYFRLLGVIKKAALANVEIKEETPGEKK